MRIENHQVKSPDPKRSRKLILHKETIKNLETNGSQTTMKAEYPTYCECSDPHESCSLKPFAFGDV